MALRKIPGMARLDRLFGRAAEPVLVLSASRKIVYLNPACEALTGVNAESVIGRLTRHHGPMRPEDPESVAAAFDPPLEVLSGTAVSTTTTLRTADGKAIAHRIDFWPYHSESGTLLFIFGLLPNSESSHLVPEATSDRLRRELIQIRDEVMTRLGLEQLIGRGPHHGRLLAQIEAAGRSRSSVLVCGPRGSGRKHVAGLIHQSGPGREGRCVFLDCQALPPDLLGRELERWLDLDPGSSEPSMARDDARTLVLTELEEMPREVQALLTRRLRAQPQAVQVIGTMSISPDEALRTDRMTPDLYFLMTPILIELVPLQDRKEEIRLFAQHFLERANQAGDVQRHGFEPEALDVLESYDWPGNLRELQRVIEEAHRSAKTPRIQAIDLPAAIKGHQGAAHLPTIRPTEWPLDSLLEQLERQLIVRALRKARQNKSKAARILQISRPRLHRRMRELGVDDVSNETGPIPEV